jgi:hypothetical protein
MDQSDYLRTKAAQCRRLAKAVTDEATVRALEEMADELDQRASTSDADKSG